MGFSGDFFFTFWSFLNILYKHSNNQAPSNSPGNQWLKLHYYYSQSFMNETQVASGSGPLYKRTRKMFSHISTAMKDVREKEISLMIITDHLLHPIKFNSGQKRNYSIVFDTDDDEVWTRKEVDKVRSIFPQILKTLDDNPELRVVFTGIE